LRTGLGLPREEDRMDLVWAALRVLHIGSAILWAGGAALFFFYIEPTINKLGPDAERFVDEVVNKRKVPIYFAAMSTVAVVAGLALYYRQAGGFQLWTTTQGLVTTVGAVAAIIAWIGGNVLITPAVKKVGAIGQEMKAAGGPPSAELVGRMHVAQESLRRVGKWDLVLIGIAILCMESARTFA
jgi:uncharacterized membrane protein